MVIMKMAVFLIVVLCSLVEVYLLPPSSGHRSREKEA